MTPSRRDVFLVLCLLSTASGAPDSARDPSVLTQSYQVLTEPRNYYQYPQYLPTNAGYTNIQTVGQPYQIYGGSVSGSTSSQHQTDSSYGVVAPAPAPSTSRTQKYQAPSPPAPEHQHSSDPSLAHRSPGTPPRYEPETVPAFVPAQGPSKPRTGPSSQSSQSSERVPQFMISPKPVLSYGAANPFLANLPPAQGPYGAPLVDSAHRADAIRAYHELNPSVAGYDGIAAPASQPASLSSVDDTWEALEASLDANTRRRHRFNVRI